MALGSNDGGVELGQEKKKTTHCRSMSLLWVVQSQTQFIKPSPACGWIGLFMWRGCASRGGSRRHITMPRRLFINSHALTVYSHFSFVSLQRSRQFLKPRTPHICNRPVCISLRALESCRSLERVSACSHLFWLYKCRNPLLVPAWQKKKKKTRPHSSTKKLLACPGQQLSLSIAAIQFTPAKHSMPWWS